MNQSKTTLLTRLTTLLVIVFVTLAAYPQTRGLAKKRIRLDSLLTARYFRSHYDTNYVVRPEGKLTLKARLNQTGNDFHSSGIENGKHFQSHLSTSHKTTFSVGAVYRGIGLGVAINPAKWRGAYKDYELNLNFYGSRFSLDASYQISQSLSGDFDTDEEKQTLQSDDVELKILNLAGYYTFNHRRFSFPAAFTQSYIQRRSAGSWLAGISYQAGSLKTTDHLTARYPNAQDVRIYVGHFGIGGGYGYNWVIDRRWLLHFSMLPTFVVFNRNNMTINGERQKAQRLRFNMIFNERAAIVHYFSPRYFAGLSLVMNNSIFDDNNVIVNQNKWRARAFIGMRI